MLRSHILLAASVALLAAISTAACGGDVSSTGTAGTAGTAGAGGSSMCLADGAACMMNDECCNASCFAGSCQGAKAPDPCDPPMPGNGTGTVLAIHKLYLGDTDRKGNPDTEAWKTYGSDIDKKISTKTSTDLCKPAAGATASNVAEDGDNGRDNSFGKNILPIITSLAADASTQVNDSIDKGSFTIMLDIEAIGADACYSPLVTKLYGGSKLVDAMGMDLLPKWDGTDEWPVINELLMGGDITKPLVQFPTSYVTKDPATGARTWVSGSAASLKLNLSVGGFTLSLDINQAQISAELSADNMHATNGMISGVIDTEQLISQLGQVAGTFDPNLCPGSPTFDSIAQEIRQASDILKDGTQDTAKTCDGISIGIGFDSDAVKLGKVADPAMMQMNPCPTP